MTNTYPTKTAMRRSKRALPQVSPWGGVRHRAKQGTVLIRSTLNELWFITWYPTAPVATRPLVYFNDRHDNPLHGRWTGRDPKGIISTMPENV